MEDIIILARDLLILSLKLKLMLDIFMVVMEATEDMVDMAMDMEDMVDTAVDTVDMLGMVDMDVSMDKMILNTPKGFAGIQH